MRGVRPWAALERLVRERAALQRGETVVAALSGGPDSTALAALLEVAARRAQATLVLGHVNHGLRASGWQDEGVALAVAAALGVRIHCDGLPAGKPAEERLREERYGALAALARRCGAQRVFTAHHARDQAETVLLALLRGAGPDGLCGMAAARPFAEGLSLERPLLDIEPAALRDYCTSAALPYAVDPTNRHLGYRRNALRAALEGLRPHFPHLDAAVARCATILRDERAATPRARLRAEIRASLVALTGEARDVTFERLDAAAAALERAERRHFLRRGVELIVE